MASENQSGLGFSERVISDHCRHVSTMSKLLEETHTGKKGRSTVDINDDVHVAHSQMSIGNTSVRKLFLAINIPLSSLSELQKRSNKVCSYIHHCNNADIWKHAEMI